MKRLTVLCAWLLAVPLLASTANHLFQLVPPPMPDGTDGARMWEIIRGGGLMDWLAAGHVVLGLALVVPKTRFAAALLQLPITLGIVAFNVTMFPTGVPLALGMLAVNLGALADTSAIRGLFSPSTSR